jgi:hypothetical protein
LSLFLKTVCIRDGERKVKRVHGRDETPAGVKQVISLRVKKTSLWFFVALLAYKISLDLIYYFIISKVWGYDKMVLNFDFFKWIESNLLLFIVFLMMQKHASKVSSIMTWLLMIFSFVPMLTLYAAKGESRTYMYSVAFFWMIVCLLCRTPSISLPSLKQRGIFFTIGIFSLGLFGALLALIQLQPSIDVLDPHRIYQIRAKYLQSDAIFLSGYIFNWLGYVVFPLFLAYFGIRKRWVETLMVLLLQLLLFSITGLKTFLFGSILLGGVLWVLHRRRPLIWGTLGLTFGVVCGMISFWLLKDIWISCLLSQRTLFAPAQLSFFYHDFFSNHGLTYLSSHRIFRNFLEYPYSLDPPHLISTLYFNKPFGSANNGILADGYMNFGLGGLVIWGILLSLLLKLLDSVSEGKNSKIAIAPILIPSVIGLANSPLFTTLSTHGLMLGILFLWLWPKTECERIIS